MDMDPKQFEVLLQTFKTELEERLQDIANCLLKLEGIEKNSDLYATTIEKIFRAAHNIKGAARSLGLKDIGEIAHHLESIFAAIQQNSLELNASIIDLCFESSDKMHTAILSHLEHTPLPFDLNELVLRLKNNNSKNIHQASPVIKMKETKVHEKNEYESIRVSVASLDKVSAMLEDIQINKIAIEEHYSEIVNLSHKSKTAAELWKQIKFLANTKNLGENFDHISQLLTDDLTDSKHMMFRLKKDIHHRIKELDVLSNSLQEEVQRLRLIPAEVLLQTLPRLVRDIATSVNKKIAFVMTGENVKMDKVIIDALQNPIMHLLRNAIDHGIETKEIRLKNNKPEEGRVGIDIKEEGDRILIRIYDDGAGIDIDAIGQLAVKKNIISNDELIKLTPTEILDFLFLPGFTSKQTITEVSGRGVGLDVVKSNIAHLKGSVHIQTVLHQGTTFELRLPLTLASERGLLIKCYGQLFMIPTHAIEQVLHVPVSALHKVESNDVILMHNEAIPLKKLGTILNIRAEEKLDSDFLSVVVIKENAYRIALLVDDIINEREIVIKSLLPPIHDVPCVMGGTLSGKGDVIIVLNANEIIQKARLLNNNIHITTKSTEKTTDKNLHILVVDDSITTRTLEKNILENHNFIVTTAVNGMEAWELLKKKKFSLLITDVTMPVMDGFTLTENVKKSQEFKDLPVIIVTSLASDAEKKRGIDAGANAFIVKNEFESEKLLEIVEQLV